MAKTSQNWYRAESEFLQSVPVEIGETASRLTVRAISRALQTRKSESAWGLIGSLSAARTVRLVAEAETCGRRRYAVNSISGQKSNPQGDARRS